MAPAFSAPPFLSRTWSWMLDAWTSLFPWLVKTANNFSLAAQPQRRHPRSAAPMMRHGSKSLWWALCFLLSLSAKESFSAQVSANEPAAMVEHIDGGPDGLSIFDYLYPGHAFDLGSAGSVSLIYFQTCLREEIHGGFVTIREHESDVEGSVRLSRKPARCGVDRRQDDADRRQTSAAVVFRGSIPVVTIDHLAPRFEVNERIDEISIVHIPSALEIFRVQLSSTILDLGLHGLRLEPGELYRIETGGSRSHLMLRVDPGAEKKNEAKTIELTFGRISRSGDGNQQ